MSVLSKRMKRDTSLLIASLFTVFLVTTCVTAAFLAGTVADSQANPLQDAASQKATLTPRVLLLQSAKPSNSTQASGALTADNMTRIIVPISRVENTSNSSAQLFSGFEFPTWLWVPVILIMLVILAYLLLKLLRDGDNEQQSLDKRPLAPASTSDARGKQLRQIPINDSEIEAEQKNSSLVTAESKTIRIPIDTSEELREQDENSP
jgi:hypothetical protein